MPWNRADAQPCWYGGTRFRSTLEANVQAAFDALGVAAAYEREVSTDLIVPAVDWYLPDFTVIEADAEYHLPLWVEAKPADLLYAVRDFFGCPERFTEDSSYDCSGAELRKNGFGEIWKPKQLAEVAEQPVLVVSALNRNHTLSIEMRPDVVVLSRSHPAVNWRQVLVEREKEEQRLDWERRRLERERQAVLVQHRQDELRRQAVGAFIQAARSSQRRPARFDDTCEVCGEQRAAADLSIFRDGSFWRRLCTSHLTGGQ